AADRRALRLARAGARRAGAVLGQVADADGGPAHRRGGPEAVGRAVVVRAVTALGRIADVDGGPADGGALRVGGAVGGRAGAVLQQVAVAGGAAALHGGRPEGVGGAVVVGAVAALGDVAVARGRAADGGALPVRRAGGARSGAVLGEIADAG